MDPQQEMYYLNLGNTYEEMRKFEDAKDSYSKAINLNAGYYKAQSNLGVLHAKNGEYDRARLCLE